MPDAQPAAEGLAAELVEGLRLDGSVHASLPECVEVATRVHDLLEAFPRSEVLAGHYAGACWAIFCHELTLREQERWIGSLAALRKRFPALRSLARTLTNALVLSSVDLPTVEARLEVIERIDAAFADHGEDEWIAEHLALALRAAGVLTNDAGLLGRLVDRAKGLQRLFPLSAEIAGELSHLLDYRKVDRQSSGLDRVAACAVAVAEVRTLYERFPREEAIAEALAGLIAYEGRAHEDRMARVDAVAGIEELLSQHPDSPAIARKLAGALRHAGMSCTDTEEKHSFLAKLGSLAERFPGEVGIARQLERLCATGEPPPLAAALDRDGFALRRLAVHPHRIPEIRWCLANGVPEAARAGARDLLARCAGLRELLVDAGMQALAEEALGGVALPIAALLFDKRHGSNWSVAAHQDLALPVAERVEAPGFEGWSVKGGVPYAQPPDHVLAGLVALRLHLDPCPRDNGALAVLPGSHSRGRWPTEGLAALRADQFTEVAAGTGDVLLLRPLLVHRSAAAKIDSRRRVLHVVYAREHPLPVRWRE